jgi:thioredoxin 1
MIKHINENNFDQEVLKNNKLTLVDFYADWCGPCKMLSPILERIASEETNFDIAKINVDESQYLAMKYQVMSIPTMILFKNGSPIDSIIGFSDDKKIRNLINNHLN